MLCERKYNVVGLLLRYMLRKFLISKLNIEYFEYIGKQIVIYRRKYIYIDLNIKL